MGYASPSCEQASTTGSSLRQLATAFDGLSHCTTLAGYSAARRTCPGCNATGSFLLTARVPQSQGSTVILPAAIPSTRRPRPTVAKALQLLEYTSLLHCYKLGPCAQLPTDLLAIQRLHIGGAHCNNSPASMKALPAPATRVYRHPPSSSAHALASPHTTLYTIRHQLFCSCQ